MQTECNRVCSELLRCSLSSTKIMINIQRPKQFAQKFCFFFAPLCFRSPRPAIRFAREGNRRWKTSANYPNKKEAFFVMKRSLVYDAKKPCLQTACFCIIFQGCRHALKTYLSTVFQRLFSPPPTYHSHSQTITLTPLFCRNSEPKCSSLISSALSMGSYSILFLHQTVIAFLGGRASRLDNKAPTKFHIPLFRSIFQLATVGQGGSAYYGLHYERVVQRRRFATFQNAFSPL